MSDQRKPTQPAEVPRDVESNDPEWQRAGGAPVEEANTQADKARQRPEQASSTKPEVQPAEVPRDVESNDPEWQRAGGAPPDSDEK